MTELDARIRAAVGELVDAAPPSPPPPEIDDRAPRRPGRSRATIALALAATVAVVVGTVVVLSGRSSGDTHVVTRAAAPSATVLGCDTVIGSDDRVGVRRTVVLGRVALSTKGQALQANRTLDPDPSVRLFAKDGLLVKRVVPVELIVPRLWRDRLSISWGGAPLTDHLKVTGCPASTPGARWLAFAGGYSVPTPVSAPLIVKVGARTQRVRIGIGRACPGQRPAPPGG